MVMSVSTCSVELREAELGAARALPALEEEGLGHDADGERALFARELRDDRAPRRCRCRRPCRR